MSIWLHNIMLSSSCCSASSSYSNTRHTRHTRDTHIHDTQEAMANKEQWEMQPEVRDRRGECVCVCVCVVLCVINPWRACARGLQYLVGLSVCVSVCLSVCLSVCVFSLFWHLAQSGVQTAVSATSARYGPEI